jgi:hypothetical protein
MAYYVVVIINLPILRCELRTSCGSSRWFTTTMRLPQDA